MDNHNFINQQCSGCGLKLGDLNMDGIQDQKDFNLLAQCNVVNIRSTKIFYDVIKNPKLVYFYLADVNQDKIINPKDLTELRAIINGNS